MIHKDRVWIRDVAPRDGFQIEAKPVSTETKIQTINALGATGVSAIQVTSFVHPKAVPQMADAEEVMNRIARYPNTRYAVLVPNLRGAERAIATRPDELNLVASASESHNQANIRKGTFDTLAEYEGIITMAEKAGIQTTGGIATAFGCPFEGRVPLERLITVVQAYVCLGVTSIGLADTTGMANPQQVRNTVRVLKDRWPNLEIYLHFHNTRGMGLANVLAGYLEGIRHFDASLGGIGGCPFAPSASGNICTEDTVHMFMEMGIDTGIDLDALIEAAVKMEQSLGYQLPGQVMKAGKTLDLHQLPCEKRT